MGLYLTITMCTHEYNLKWNNTSKVHECSNCDEEFLVPKDAVKP